jgi:hypothetical protein
MLFANLKNSGTRVTVFKIGTLFSASNGTVSNASTFECDGLEAWAQRNGFIRSTMGRF